MTDGFSDVRGGAPRLLPYLTEELATQEDRMGRNFIHHAAARRSEAFVKKCLDIGVDVHAQTGSGRTALHYAARYPHLAIIKMLVQAGSDVEMLDEQGQSPLAYMASLAPEQSRARSWDRYRNGSQESSRQSSPLWSPDIDLRDLRESDLVSNQGSEENKCHDCSPECFRCHRRESNQEHGRETDRESICGHQWRRGRTRRRNQSEQSQCLGKIRSSSGYFVLRRLNRHARM